MLLALVLMRFLSGSLLAAMGEACGGIFAAGHGFLAASNWNYLLAIAVAAIFISQLAFLIGGGSRLLRVSHKGKVLKRASSISCPALPVLTGAGWASKVCVIPGEPALQAQTIGLVSPRIVLSEGITRTLSREDLSAVVAHEEAHRSARDNLLLVLAKSLALTLFYLPGSRLAYRGMQAGLERAADLRASRAVGDALAVAGALARVMQASETVKASGGRELTTAVTGHGSDLESRLTELIGSGDRPSRWRRHAVVFSAGVMLILAVFSSSALAVAGSDQREAFVCFTQHQQISDSDDICTLDHPDHS